jgi:hypothetical protein
MTCPSAHQNIAQKTTFQAAGCQRRAPVPRASPHDRITETISVDEVPRAFERLTKPDDEAKIMIGDWTKASPVPAEGLTSAGRLEMRAIESESADPWSSQFSAHAGASTRHDGDLPSEVFHPFPPLTMAA